MWFSYAPDYRRLYNWSAESDGEDNKISTLEIARCLEMTSGKTRAKIKPAKDSPVAGKRSRPRAARLSKEERAAQIRMSALRVLARHGIGHTNHTMVAAEAQVSLPTVFFYFPTHQQLTDSVLNHVSDFLLNGILNRVVTSVGDPQAIIEKTFLEFAESIDEEGDMARVWLDWSTAVRDETWPRYLVFHREACRVIRGVIESGQANGNLRKDVDASEAAEVVVSLAHMVAHMKFAGSDHPRIQHTVQTLIRNYIGMPPSAAVE